MPAPESDIGPGDYVTVETPHHGIVSGMAFLDSEGVLRIDDGTHEINLDRDSDGYLKYGTVVISVTR